MDTTFKKQQKWDKLNKLQIPVSPQPRSPLLLHKKNLKKTKESVHGLHVDELVSLQESLKYRYLSHGKQFKLFSKITEKKPIPIHMSNNNYNAKIKTNYH
jgi:hypothetical protein